MNLIGRKVVLRAIEKEDNDFLRDMMNDPELEKWVVGSAYPVSVSQQEKWYESQIGCMDPLRLIVETKKDGVVGLAILGDFDWKNRCAHLSGIKLQMPKITESGIAIDAIITLFGYGFMELNLNRIEGTALVYNKRSEAINKYIGLKVEGIMRQAVYKNGKYQDLYMLAVLKEDFMKRNGKRFISM